MLALFMHPMCLAVRAQFVDEANPKKVDTKTVETPVLDYRMQQYRLFPIIAQAYACHFTAIEMHRMYYENQEKMAQGDFSYLADLHASSSGLKSLTTTLGVAGIEECRRACGGHGYSLFSGLGQFYQDYLPKVTVSDQHASIAIILYAYVILLLIVGR